MNQLQEYVLEIERLKLLISLDHQELYTTEYEGEMEALYQLLKPLLKKQS
jgi:hypothetical protein